MPESDVDLARLFSAATQALQGEKDALNEADSFNHDHGTNMLESFKIITQAVEEKQGDSPSEQLAYASQKLDQSAASGSARRYSQGLARAAARLQGQTTLTGENALGLVQALLSAGEAEAPAELEVKGKSSGGSSLDTLLAAGSAYMESKQKGDSALEALLQAFIAGKSKPSHQSQSDKVVGGTLVNIIGELLGIEQPKPKPKPRPKPKPSSKKPRPESKVKPGAKPKSPAKPKPKPASKPKPESAVKTKPKPTTKPRPATKPKPKPRSES